MFGISETFGMNFLSGDKLLKLCLINLWSVGAGQKCSACPLMKHRHNCPGSESAMYFCAHGWCWAEEVPQIPECRPAPAQWLLSLPGVVPMGSASSTCHSTADKPSTGSPLNSCLNSHPSLWSCVDPVLSKSKPDKPSLWGKREKRCKKWQNSDEMPRNHWKIVSYNWWSALAVKLHLTFLGRLV